MSGRRNTDSERAVVASFGAPKGPPRRGCVVEGETPLGPVVVPGAVVPGAVVVDVVVLSGDAWGDVVEDGAVPDDDGSDGVVVVDVVVDGVVACCAKVGTSAESAAKPTAQTSRYRPRRGGRGGIRVRLLNRIISH